MSRNLPVKVIWSLMGGRWGVRLLPIVLLFAFVVLHAPAALAFPFQRTIGATVIYSEVPIQPEISRLLDRSDRLLRASAVYVPNVPRKIVLTNGGWRWKMLALGNTDAVALRRPYSDVLIFNRSDVSKDRVTSGVAIGGVRTLSRTVAHEMTHLLVARRIGEINALRLPVWKREGYADYVGGETSVGVSDEARIRAHDPNSAVLTYYEGRRRVAAALRNNGGSVDRLFAE